MRAMIFAFICCLVLGSVLYAEDGVTPPFDSGDASWRIRYNTNWYVEREDDGLTFPILEDTVVKNCGGVLDTLSEGMKDTKVTVFFKKCENGANYVVHEIQIVCD